MIIKAASFNGPHKILEGERMVQKTGLMVVRISRCETRNVGEPMVFRALVARFITVG